MRLTKRGRVLGVGIHMILLPILALYLNETLGNTVAVGVYLAGVIGLVFWIPVDNPARSTNNRKMES